MKRFVLILGVIVSLMGFATLGAHAALIATGSPVSYALTNMPTSLPDGTPIPSTFNTPGLTVAGDVQIFSTQVATGGGGEWDFFFFSTADGAPIGTNPNAFWQIVPSFILTQAVNFNGIEDQWTTGGANPPNGLGGTPVPAADLNEGFINFVGTGPLGDGFVNGFGTAGVGVGSFSDPLAAGLTPFPQFVSPYSFANTGGGVPTDADGFNLALHFDPQVPPTATPEPATLLLMGLGLAGAAFLRRGKTRTAG